MNLRDLHIHDSLIISINENPRTDEIVFYINWPGDRDDNIFTKAELIFEHALNYEIHEGPFAGNPTILDIIEDGSSDDHSIIRTKLKIETNAGYRTLYCTDVKLIEKK